MTTGTADLSGIQVLACDVFGTMVDWRTSIIQAGRRLDAARDREVDWGRFADAWRGGYKPALDRVRQGELPWTNLNVLHRLLLDALLPEFGLGDLDETGRAALNGVWERLRPWPDSRRGLRRLRRRFVVVALSNGNMALLTRLSKHAGLAWDCILSAELVGHYKPDPAVYAMAARFLALPPAAILMVAAHKDDLRGAQAAGLHTAFLPRPREYGPAALVDATPDPAFDLTATDLDDLARQLGA